MTGSAGPEQQAVSALMATLTPQHQSADRFLGPRATEGWQRVFGGLVLGQALSAASMTVDAGRPIHSLHGYFLLAGDPNEPISYEVERLRDGGSFTTRRVRAVQRSETIFSMSASFHKNEPGYEHQTAMPDVPAPETLPSAKQLMAGMMAKLPETLQAYWKRPQPLDVRIVDASRYISRESRPAQQSIWLKAAAPLPDHTFLHQAIAAYASDFTLLDTALIAHGRLLFDRDLQLASLDHAMWFHRPFRIDDWLLYVQDSPSASGGRGYCRGTLFDRAGRLVASTVQEGLMRVRTSDRI